MKNSFYQVRIIDNNTNLLYDVAVFTNLFYAEIVTAEKLKKTSMGGGLTGHEFFIEVTNMQFDELGGLVYRFKDGQLAYSRSLNMKDLSRSYDDIFDELTKVLK